MTNENYTQFTNIEIIEKIKSLNVHVCRMNTYIKKHHPELFHEVVQRTSFLDKNYNKSTVPFLARIYCLKHNLSEQPRCQNPNCNNPVEWYSGIKSFRQFCCPRCSTLSKETQNKMKQTCIKRFGIENPMQSDLVKAKIIETNRNRFGVDYPMQSIKVQNKYKESMIQSYGFDSPIKCSDIRDKINQTNLKKYGSIWVFGSQHGKDMIRQTFIEEYGVDNYAKTIEYHKKKQHKFISERYPELRFDSRWEVKVYEFCKDNNISIEYSPEISYNYEYDGRIWTYHPDFLINKGVYEVKGEHFFIKNKNTGVEEMTCPYRNPNWSEEYYIWICKKSEAKHQCMLTNNVTILRKKEIDNLSIEMFNSQPTVEMV